MVVRSMLILRSLRETTGFSGVQLSPQTPARFTITAVFESGRDGVIVNVCATNGAARRSTKGIRERIDRIFSSLARPLVRPSGECRPAQNVDGSRLSQSPVGLRPCPEATAHDLVTHNR